MVQALHVLSVLCAAFQFARPIGHYGGDRASIRCAGLNDTEEVFVRGGERFICEAALGYRKRVKWSIAELRRASNIRSLEPREKSVALW